jgi:nondiscriminating glutamyl-tRNA synthetase
MIKKESQIEDRIRVRLAPSPTGFLHIGTARVGLFNFLFARKHNGCFIIRIEDTDEERSRPVFEKDILEGLRWLSISWDEGPSLEKGQDYKGNYGPYRQSERRDIYEKYIKKLLEEDKAYYCFCPKEELEKHREYMMSIGRAPAYSGKCRELSKEEIEKNLAEKKPYIIRFKTPSKKIIFTDLIRDKVEFDSGSFGDFSIAKDERNPLYNLAVAIDDFEMKITHVIRGEDHISNTPKQILLQEALNIPSVEYVHLPLILGEDRSKLSKRHGAVSINEYKEEGYLSESLVNIMALLGWNPGTDREIFSLPSLVKEFSLDRCQKGGAILNKKRLDWINGFYIKKSSLEKITELCIPYLVRDGLIEEIENNYGNLNFPNNSNSPKELKLFKEKKRKFRIIDTKEAVDVKWIEKIIALYHERLKKISEITELTDFFFKEKLNYSANLLIWKNATEEETIEAIKALERKINKIESNKFNQENIKNEIMPEAEEKGDRGKVLWPFRVALSGKKASAGPFEIAEVLGKEKVLKRLKQAKELF